MKGLAAADLQAGQAILFVLVKRVTGDKVLEQLQGRRRHRLQTSLDHTREEAAPQGARRRDRRSDELNQRDETAGGRNLRRPAAFATAPPEEERTMFWTASRLGDFELETTDGPIGAIRDCLFDDRNWKVRCS